MHKGAAIGIACGAFVTLILGIVSVATAAWVVVPIISTSYGLWEVCTDGRCTSFTGTFPDYWMAVQAFHILGVISCAVAVAASGMLVVGKGPKALAPILFSVTAAFFLISMSIFTAEQPLVSGVESWGYSYILGWVAFALSIVLAVASGVTVKRS